MPSVTATAILKSYNTAHIREQLVAMPGKLYAGRVAVDAARREYNGTLNDLKTAEADLALNVAAAIDEKTGKPLYGNAETRTAAMISLKRTDEDYRVAHESVMTAEEQMNLLQAEYDRLSDEYKGYRVIAKLITAELQLLADDDDAPASKEAAATGDEEVW